MYDIKRFPMTSEEEEKIVSVLRADPDARLEDVGSRFNRHIKIIQEIARKHGLLRQVKKAHGSEAKKAPKQLKFPNRLRAPKKLSDKSFL